MTTTETDMVKDYVADTFPNSDTEPLILIPWGNDAGMAVDDDGEWRIGIYDSLMDNPEPVAMLYLKTAAQVIRSLEYLTECQPEGTDWAAWATQRIADDGVPFNG